MLTKHNQELLKPTDITSTIVFQLFSLDVEWVLLSTSVIARWLTIHNRIFFLFNIWTIHFRNWFSLTDFWISVFLEISRVWIAMRGQVFFWLVIKQQATNQHTWWRLVSTPDLTSSKPCPTNHTTSNTTAHSVGWQLVLSVVWILLKGHVRTAGRGRLLDQQQWLLHCNHKWWIPQPKESPHLLLS